MYHHFTKLINLSYPTLIISALQQPTVAQAKYTITSIKVLDAADMADESAVIADIGALQLSATSSVHAEQPPSAFAAEQIIKRAAENSIKETREALIAANLVSIYLQKKIGQNRAVEYKSESKRIALALSDLESLAASARVSALFGEFAETIAKAEKAEAQAIALKIEAQELLRKIP